MVLSQEQIEYIETNLKFYGVASGELREDLLDHICTYIEEGNFEDFETAYHAALQKFGGHHAMGSIQRETFLMTVFRNNIRRKMVVYIAVFIAVALVMTGGLFKTMHWPGASVILCLGMIVFVFVALPLFLYQRYKEYYRRSVS